MLNNIIFVLLFLGWATAWLVGASCLSYAVTVFVMVWQGKSDDDIKSEF